MPIEFQTHLDQSAVTLYRGTSATFTIGRSELPHVIEVLRTLAQDWDLGECATCGKVAETWGTVAECADCLADAAERALPA